MCHCQTQQVLLKKPDGTMPDLKLKNMLFLCTPFYPASAKKFMLFSTRKWMAFASIALLSFSILAACKKEPGAAAGSANPADMKQGAETIAAFFDKHQTQKEHFQINATDGAVLTTRDGTRINLARNAFRLNGSLVSGDINLWVHDILYASNMLLADNPTVSAGGDLLESYGQIILSADQGGQRLQLAPDAATAGLVAITFPIGMPQGRGQLPVWVGDTTSIATTTGYDGDNAPTAVAAAVRLQRGIAWTQIPGAVSEASTLGNSFHLAALDQWFGTGMPYSDTRPKTTVLGYLGAKYNTLTGDPTSVRGPSLLFFKTRATNTLVKYHQFILNPTAGKEGFLSYQGKIPVGQEGTFLAISALGDKLYAETRDLALPEPQSGRNFVSISFKLAEVTEPQLLALIQQLNKK